MERAYSAPNSMPEGGNMMSYRLSELERRLKSAEEVNANLRGMVEQLSLENDSYKDHVKRLNTELVQHLAKDREAKMNGTAVLSKVESSKSQKQKKGGILASSTMPDADWKDLEEYVGSKEWNISIDEVELGAVLGHGTFGVTLKGNWNGVTCAVKQIHVKEDTKSQFKREVDALSRVRHPHVVSFLGAVVDKSQNACWILLEYISRGTLNDAIRGKESNNLLVKKPLSLRLQILADVASGMAALERQDPSIVHRDLKPSNVLLDSAMRGKVSDMGLAKILTRDAIIHLTPETGTYVYMAPEVVGHNTYGTAADVWSWACTAIEVLTLEYPYQRRLLTPIQVALEVMKYKMRPEVSEEAVGGAKMGALLKKCFSFTPSERPTFSQIAEEMRTITDNQMALEAKNGLRRSSGIMNFFGRPASPTPSHQSYEI
jgi:serine/threonine protein kinase